MNPINYILRFLYHIRYWLILVPSAVAVIIYIGTSALPRTYDVSTTLYTGVVSGFDIESSGGQRQDWNSINNAMDNITSIIMAKTTLKNVSMHLYAQHMIFGDATKDNNYITRDNYQAIYTKSEPHKDILALIDKTSEDNTVENLRGHEKQNSKDYLYGLFNWTHRHYSYDALSKIRVKRLGNSDMIEVKYTADDPGIAYNTLAILNVEFMKQYEELRFGETNKVIAYFEAELARVAILLRHAEDSLTSYNVANKVINYEEQTKIVAAMGRDHELKYEEILLAYQSSIKLIDQFESQMGERVKLIKNNSRFINKLNDISSLTTRIATIESFRAEGSDTLNTADLSTLRAQLRQTESDLKQLDDVMSQQQFTKEGISLYTVVEQWLSEIVRNEKAKAELNVMLQRKEELNSQYAYFSPIGSTLKRLEREINFLEQSYLNILTSLNAARLRQKNLQMTSATIKVVNPPTFPISAIPTKRKLMVAAGFFGSFIFILFAFVIVELLDRTLRDKERTERLTGGRVLCAMPAANRFWYRYYNNTWLELATHYMSNALANYLRPQKGNIINLISTEPGDGKSFVAQQLYDHWSAMGVSVRLVTYGVDFTTDRQFYAAQSLKDICGDSDEDIIIVEYPSLHQAFIPETLLREASVNVMIARATRAWKDTDRLLYANVVGRVGTSPLMICLTKADCMTVENFTGLLPPYSFFRRLGYRLFQFGLTSAER